MDKVNIMKSDYGEEFMPEMKNEGDAGFDFKCPKDIIIFPGEWVDIDTGIHLEEGDIETDMHIELHPRSGQGFNYGLKLRNTTGIIDAGYRESIKARITVEKPNADLGLKGTKKIYWDARNGGSDGEIELDNAMYVPVFVLRKGDRFMQGIVCKHYHIAGLDRPTAIRNGGLGSTGTR